METIDLVDKVLEAKEGKLREGGSDLDRLAAQIEKTWGDLQKAVKRNKKLGLGAHMGMSIPPEKLKAYRNAQKEEKTLWDKYNAAVSAYHKYRGKVSRMDPYESLSEKKEGKLTSPGMKKALKGLRTKTKCPFCSQPIPVYPGRYPKCLHGETLIPLLDGTESKIKDLVGKEFWVYAWDHDKKKITASSATASQTVSQEEMVRVTLDNGETIICTPEHPFMLRDGSYKRADELEQGQSLMPLYAKISQTSYKTGYRLVMQPDSPKRMKWEPVHWLVGRVVKEDYDPAADVMHHIDFDRLNNDPSNLQLMSRVEHSRFHQIERGERHRKKYASNEEYREEYRKRLSEGCKQGWEDADERRALAAERASNQIREQWKDPAFRERVRECAGEGIKRKWATDKDYRVKISTISSENARKRNANPTEAMLRQREEFLRKGRVSRKNMPKKDRVRASEHCKRLNSFRTFLKEVGLTRVEFPFKDYVDLFCSTPVAADPNNHTVVSVMGESGLHDGYDLHVEGYHNFSVAAGVFVHNSCPSCGKSLNTSKKKESISMDASVMLDTILGKADPIVPEEDGIPSMVDKLLGKEDSEDPHMLDRILGKKKEGIEEATSPADDEKLEMMIDGSSLSSVLDAIAEICHMKADHIMSNWQDAGLADDWSKAGSSVDALAAKTRRVLGL